MVGLKRINYQAVKYFMQRFLLQCSDPDLGLLPVPKKDFHPPVSRLGHPLLVSPQMEAFASCKVLYLCKGRK